MPNLLAISFEGELAPSFDLRCLAPGRKLPDGWGLAYYPGGEPSASVLKEPAPPSGSIRGELVRAWEHLASSIFVVHIRTATWGSNTDANTQPFCKSWGGRDWILAHGGSLRLRPAPGPAPRFEPVGATDTEAVFCVLLERFAEHGIRTLRDADPELVRRWLSELNELGELDLVLSDGSDVLAYADRHGGGETAGGLTASAPARMFVAQLTPTQAAAPFGDHDLGVDLARRGAKARKGVIFSSERLIPDEGGELPWAQMAPGSLLVARQGAIVASAYPPNEEPVPSQIPQVPQIPHLQTARGALTRPKKAEVRRYQVRHLTRYTYDQPVERSTHVLRLEPQHDRLQTLIAFRQSLSVDADVRDFEDVFGNRVRRVHVETPFQELVIEATSTVELLDTDPLGLHPKHVRSTIPLVWMPWHRQILAPYLLPPELPETQLLELTEYAMSFVARNDSDLIDTLLDMNATIHAEYAYRQGETTLGTTAFEVYASRRGVCQDFANLFICLARLLGVPARYACGYIYTGPKHANTQQSEASHAWVQVYLPEIGWKGFDPTNGILTQTEHVRVAVGRNYVDATPTSGTIFVGGGGEKLAVDVRVEPL
jgi:transglutaminase-like putative cysteine protease/predicted glutamine amidotransferase